MHRPAPRFPGAEEQEVLVGAAQTGSSLAAPARCSERYLYRADTRTARRISLSHERFGGAVDAPAEGVQLNKPGGIVERSKLAVGDETVELEVDGRMVLIVTRPADGDALARLFELDASPKWADSTPMNDREVASVVSRLIERADENGEQAEVLGVPPAAAEEFPNDPRIYVSPVEPLTFSLPSSPTGLVLHMDERGDGHLWALGDDRIGLGSDGMWWTLNGLIEALADPSAASGQPRFLTLGSSLGGPATQASLESGGEGVRIVWRRLSSGVVGDVVAVQELSFDRVDGWLRLLRPVRGDLERRRVHRQRLRPARTAEKWAHALERWSS
ncbi:MAG: hypothetical protein ABSE58_07915 [Candidatus Limnocylindrales bacterium]|jgi:hypothetical protein